MLWDLAIMFVVCWLKGFPLAYSLLLFALA